MVNLIVTIPGRSRRIALLACLMWAGTLAGPATLGAAPDDGPAPAYTVDKTVEHMKRVRSSAYVTPTASADDELGVGRSRGWSESDSYPYDTDAVHDRLAPYADHAVIPSHKLFGYRITGIDPDAGDDKLRVLVTTGNHNTEYTGSWAFEAFIDFLLSDDERADAMRRKAVFYVYPLVNPDGRYTLASRSNPEIVTAGWLDHNRMWHTAGMFSTIDQLVPAIRYDTAGRVDYALDFHSASSTFLFTPSDLLETPFVEAIANEQPGIEPRRFDTPGTTQNWARADDGVRATFAYTPELDNGETADRSREIGRSYAVALYETLLGAHADSFEGDAPNDEGSPGPANDAPADDLLAAARAGEARVLRELIEAEHELTVTDARGNTALHLAAKHGHEDAITVLLDADAALLDQRNAAGRTALYLATQASHRPAMKPLADAMRARLEADEGAVTRRFSAWHFTLLHEAAGAGETERARVLLDLGASLDARDHVRRTPLRHAAEGGHADTAAMLLERGAAVDARDGAGNTPLHLAAMGCRPRMEHWFTYCRGGCLALDEPCEVAFPDLALVLIDHGATVSAPNDRGWTPLHYAARYGHAEMARVLLENRADVDAADALGDTALHIAAQHDHAEVVKALLEHGAAMHVEGNWSRTPLQWARRLGYERIERLFEAHAGAD